MDRDLQREQPACTVVHGDVSARADVAPDALDARRYTKLRRGQPGDNGARGRGRRCVGQFVAVVVAERPRRAVRRRWRDRRAQEHKVLHLEVAECTQTDVVEEQVLNVTPPGVGACVAADERPPTGDRQLPDCNSERLAIVEHPPLRLERQRCGRPPRDPVVCAESDERHRFHAGRMPRPPVVRCPAGGLPSAPARAEVVRRLGALRALVEDGRAGSDLPRVPPTRRYGTAFPMWRAVAASQEDRGRPRAPVPLSRKAQTAERRKKPHAGHGNVPPGFRRRMLRLTSR